MLLKTPPDTDARLALYSRDVAEDGYVANLTRLWAWRPDVYDAFSSVRTVLAPTHWARARIGNSPLPPPTWCVTRWCMEDPFRNRLQDDVCHFVGPCLCAMVPSKGSTMSVELDHLMRGNASSS